MTPSDPPRDDLPPALESLRRTFVLGYRAEPKLLSLSLVIILVTALPDALMAVWLGVLADGIADGRRTPVIAGALALGVSSTLTWYLGVLFDRTQRRFRDRVSIALESHVARLQATIATIEHQERPALLDRLSMLRNQVFALDHLFMSIFSTLGWLLRLAITMVILVTVHPALILLLVAGAPILWIASWRPAVERRVEESVAARRRLARHLLTLPTNASSAKELRTAGTAALVEARRHEAWDRAYRAVAATRWRSALWHTLAWAVFGGAYVGAVVFVTVGLDAGPGTVLLVLAAGMRLLRYVGVTVGEIGFLRGIWLDSSRRLVWLEDYAAASTPPAAAPVPARLQQAIRFEDVSFRYPGTDRLVLDRVDLTLPAGAVVAIVGENGAGKTTLVKLLCRLYSPTDGRITVDGTDLQRFDVEGWRARLAGAFQDFFRFEFRARSTVGLGDLPRLDDLPAVTGAVGRAGADDVVAGLPDGLESQLGQGWDEGIELSHGQWQKLALARGFMRERPLLLVLDEPTSALDAETEHALFERYAEAGRRERGEGGSGGITLLVSHRFSTVRMADLIVVLDGARLVEVGTHEELVARGGQYAELYAIQAAAFRT